MELLKTYRTLSNLPFQNQISLDVEYFADGSISIVRSIKLETDCIRLFRYRNEYYNVRVV